MLPLLSPVALTRSSRPVAAYPNDQNRSRAASTDDRLVESSRARHEPTVPGFKPTGVELVIERAEHQPEQPEGRRGTPDGDPEPVTQGLPARYRKPSRVQVSRRCTGWSGAAARLVTRNHRAGYGFSDQWICPGQYPARPACQALADPGSQRSPRQLIRLHRRVDLADRIGFDGQRGGTTSTPLLFNAPLPQVKPAGYTSCLGDNRCDSQCGRAISTQRQTQLQIAAKAHPRSSIVGGIIHGRSDSR